MTNLEVAKLLRSVAAALSLSSTDNNFRIMAYERAADTIEHATSEAKDLWDDGNLKSLAGIGDAIYAHLDELFRTGKVKHFAQILKPYPPALFELLDIPGIGPKNAFKLCKYLGINSAHSAISRLERAARKDKISQIEGFGLDSQIKILQSLKELRGRSNRLLLPVAQTIAEDIITWMGKIPQALSIDPLGSLRRGDSTIGDIDIAVAANDPQTVISHFVSYPRKSRVLKAGEHTASIVTTGDHQVDLMVQPPRSYGSLLQHFTGSKHHNIALREIALKKGYSLSEYGIKVGDQIKEFPDEKSFYNFLGLDWIPPELRENKSEILSARTHKLPDLVEPSHVKGDLHVHSNIDTEPSHDLGTSSLEELVSAAKRLKYEYFGITDHNPSASSHSPSQILEIIQKRSNLIRKYSGFPIFVGMEIDIQANGQRALPDACLDFLDYACVSIHSSFRQTRKLMTDRIIAGLDHPKVKFLAHPTARLLREREGVEIDWDRLFDFCLRNSKWLEIDSWPNRLDLPDTIAHKALEKDVKLIINSDSHSAAHMINMKYGILTARRAWATKNDIVNTQNLTQVRKLLIGGD